jgi:hypothetical protein
MLRAGALRTWPGRTLEDMGKTGPSGKPTEPMKDEKKEEKKP